MIFSIAFPILNKVQVKHPWPVSVGNQTFFIKTKDELATAVGIQYSGVSIDVAPVFEKAALPGGTAQIKLGSSAHSIVAERDLRAWQSLLTAYVLIDIDFDSPTLEFRPENDDEKSRIVIHNFSRTKNEIVRGSVEFGILGRAFLGREKGRDLIEVMALFREANKALFSERYIDAYNQFYLFLETQFCEGQTGAMPLLA
jgi:hypothetical protein